MPINTIKKTVGYYAADLIQDEMLVGLGTGSTAFFFIERLIQRCHEGLTIQAVASSQHSLILAQKGNLPLLSIDTISYLDVTVDGADEIDPQKRMIKGGGGAHVREKIVASISKEMIVIIDESKQVDQLGTKCVLPVEIIPFAPQATLNRIHKLGYQGQLRTQPNHSLFITDNGNYIVDIQFKQGRLYPEEDHEALIHLPGVIDTGFFFHLAGRVIVGLSNGKIKHLE